MDRGGCAANGVTAPRALQEPRKSHSTTKDVTIEKVDCEIRATFESVRWNCIGL
jgi:hypothetical protein